MTDGRSGIQLEKDLGETDMRKHFIISCTIMIITFIGLECLYAMGNKSAELKLKMTEITALQQSLNGKMSQVAAKKDQLEQKTQELKREIRDQNEQYRIRTYQKALLNPRIDYNLKLIQLLIGYVARLNDKIVYFKNGHATLYFFFQQAQDDLLMIKTLNDLEIDKLIAQINEVLDEYSPEINKPMFDVNDIPLKDTRQIWQEIIETN
jgi:triphosphoribosyl-dephospho-CoA synthetase